MFHFQLVNNVAYRFIRIKSNLLAGALSYLIGSLGDLGR